MPGRLRNCVPVVSQGLNVKFDCLFNQLARLFQRRRGGNTTRKVGDMRAVSGGGWFDENGVSAHVFVQSAHANGRVSLWPRLNQAVIIGVTTNPVPDDAISLHNRQSAVPEPYLTE